MRTLSTIGHSVADILQGSSWASLNADGALGCEEDRDGDEAIACSGPEILYHVIFGPLIGDANL